MAACEFSTAGDRVGGMDGGLCSVEGVPFPLSAEGLVLFCGFYDPLVAEFLLVQEGIRLKSYPWRLQIRIAWGLREKGKAEILATGLLKGCLKHHVSSRALPCELWTGEAALTPVASQQFQCEHKVHVQGL